MEIEIIMLQHKTFQIDTEVTEQHRLMHSTPSGLSPRPSTTPRFHIPISNRTLVTRHFMFVIWFFSDSLHYLRSNLGFSIFRPRAVYTKFCLPPIEQNKARVFSV